MSAGHRLLTLAILALITIIAFEAMAVSTAMPVVARELDAVRSYGLAFSFLLTGELLGIVVSGLWSDRRGPLTVLIAGQLLLAAGSVMAGLAGGLPMLLAGRLVAGLGSGLNVVAVYVVIGRAYPDAARPKVFSWISAAWVLPSLAGPPVAGLLATAWSWRWVFLVVVVPIAVVMAVVIGQRRRLVGDAPSATAADPASQRRAAGLGLAVALAAAAMQVGAERLVPVDVPMLLLTAAGLAGLAWAFPRLVPRGTLRLARGLPAVMASRFLLTAAFNGAMTFVPLMLVTERGLTPALSGAMLTVGALGWSLGSYLQGRDAWAGRRSTLVSAGGGLLAAGVAGLAFVAALGLPSVVIAAASTLCGLGMGLAMSSTSVLSLALSRREDHGGTAASLNLADVLGSVVGVAAAGALFAALHDPAGSDLPVFVLIWALLAALAALVVVGGARTRP